jgi:hypothetical protein
MPRIPDDFIDSVLYLYPSTHEAQEGINIGGSGFLVSVEAEQIAGSHFIYAVTNRHVIDVADVIRLNTKEGKTHIEKISKGEWVCSETDDLAVHTLMLDPAIFAYKTVPHDMILTEEKAGQLKLGIGDNVFMVGRFINHEGKQRNAPLVRFGSIAQMPTEPLTYELDGKLHEQVSILADIRSIGGYSGSPVFLNELGFIGRPDGPPADKHWLIGVDWGHIKMWSPLCGTDEKPLGTSQVNINSGMAGIVPAWKLLELLMSERLAKPRKDSEDRHISAKNATAAAADSAVPLAVPLATDANPKHREDFTSLVGAAARKRAQEG